MAAVGVFLRRQQTGIETVFRLVVDPILVPDFFPVFLLERGEAFVLEEVDKQSDGWFLEIIRSARSQRTGVE
jgi:hypothetical protein